MGIGTADFQNNRYKTEPCTSICPIEAQMMQTDLATNAVLSQDIKTPNS